MTEKQTDMIGKLVLAGMVCALGAATMYWTNGSTGIGWAMLGLFLIY